MKKIKILSIKKYLSPLFLFLAALIFGVSFSAQKIASAVPPFTLVAFRSLVASIFLFLILPITDKLQGNRRLIKSQKAENPLFSKWELLGGVVCGAVLALASVLQQSGIGEGTDAGKASFITALYIVLVPILGLFVGKKPRWNVWLSVILATIGFFLLCVEGEFRLSTSDLLVLLCSLGFALQIIAVDFFAPKGDGVRISCIQFLTSACLCAILAFILESPIDIKGLAPYLPQLLFLAIGSSGIAYTLQIVGQKGTPPTASSLILSLESVFGALAAAIFIGETLLLKEFVGCIIVFIAVILAQVNLQKK